MPEYQRQRAVLRLGPRICLFSRCIVRPAPHGGAPILLPRGEALRLAEHRDGRVVWSCSLLKLPEEDRTQRLAEQLQSPDASFWDDALALREYIRLSGLSQAECARAMGRSQAGVANRLRLLRLPEDVRERMRAEGLTERHARALLRLREADLRPALEHIVAAGLNVAETESYVERCLARARDADAVPAEFEPLLAALERLRRSVPEVSFSLEEQGEAVELRITLPKKSR